MNHCTVAGCEAPLRSRNATYCQKHYHRMRRLGELELPPGRTREACIMGGCDALDDGPHGYCKKHSTRIRRHGDPNVRLATGNPGGPGSPLRTETPTYGGMHQRIRRDFGPATEHRCSCGRPARQWAYNHQDPSELDSDFGPYSRSTDFYVAMCVPCHKRMDLARIAGSK